MKKPRLFRGCRTHRVVLLVAIIAWTAEISYGAAQTSAVLRVSSIQSNGWVRISGRATNFAVITLEASSNLLDWQQIALLQDSEFEFADPVAHQVPQRFYRFSAVPYASTNTWKNQISAPRDYFAPEEVGEWIKFAILTDDPTRVYYANGGAYLFHYDFATTHLNLFTGFDEGDFDAVSLYNAGRKVLLGAVLFPRDERIAEYGIQFVSQDPLPRELVRDMVELVESTVVPESLYGAYSLRGFYMPTFEQMSSIEADRAWFETNGVAIGSPARWASGNTCYSSGWALGTLKFFSVTEIETAYAEGRLRPEDILLTDVVPAELPYVAGIISLTASTPNSHVAILARSHNVPFVHLWDAAEKDRVNQMAGSEITFQISSYDGYDDSGRSRTFCTVDINALPSDFDPKLKAEILAVKNPVPIKLDPITLFGGYTASTDNLIPADTKFFGGKAANYGLLRRTIPSNAPPAIAISFDLWSEFMAQTMADGKTLRQEISNRLAGLDYPAHIPQIKSNLGAIRAMIRQHTEFTVSQREAIVSPLRIFNSRKNIRFRSSTNVEDSETFTGAGLYDSYSGCLDDDLDADTDGSSHCDPTEEDERGVFRAIRRVYASFYNDNAYLERLRRGVDENQVGMAMLVHHSTPDDIEMANGVATVATHRQYPMVTAELVSQTGAISVANPTNSGMPEIVHAVQPEPPYDIWVSFVQPSDLVVLGKYVMEWDSDYRALSSLLLSVRNAYQQMVGNEGEFVLDFEYKKIKPGRLEVKQVREIPLPQNTDLVPTFLLDEPVTFVPYQGYNEDGPFPNHRLKSRWTLRTRNLRLSETNFTSTPYVEATIEHLNGGRIETLSGPLQSFQNYSNRISYSRRADSLGLDSYDSWQMSSLAGPISVELTTGFSGLSPSHGNLLLTIRDTSLRLTAKYNHPVLYNHHSWGLVKRTNDTISLIPLPRPTPEDWHRESKFTFPGGRPNITTRATFGPSMVHGLQTRIEGLTSQPIVLTNYFSQTIDLGHLSAGPQYLFEPRLEPGVSATTLAELEGLNIRLLYLRQPLGRYDLFVMGREGDLRNFGSVSTRR